MTHHTMITPAVILVAQPNDKYKTNSNQISFTMDQNNKQQQKSYVSSLVEVTIQVMTTIWPRSVQPNDSTHKPIADLHTFLHHILKHSRTTHSTLQLAIFYLFRVRTRVQQKSPDDAYISCGRRMFLASLISAHKYLQDKTYKNSAWSKVSGLNVQEINHAEKIMLELLDYRLHVKKEVFDQWMLMLQSHLKVAHPWPLPPHVQAPVVSPSPLPFKPPTALEKAQQSLPSPPLEEDVFVPIQRKRKYLSTEHDALSWTKKR
ncbi:cyclin-domain-containing protein [Sporodiniella umbellata]|nr:cyclin-domain-containing protein [Sporodiniella umbellata]